MEDALSYVQNGERAVSLNSISNLTSFTQFLAKNYCQLKKWEFVISFDHDNAVKCVRNENTITLHTETTYVLRAINQRTGHYRSRGV